MSFWMIFWAVLLALLAHFVIVETIGFLATRWLQRKQARLVAEFQQKIDSGELNPMDFVSGMPGEAGGGFPPFPQPTASGTLGTLEPHGQYL